MLMPKRTKYRKVHRGKRRGPAKGGTKVSFGDYGLQALEAGWIRPARSSLLVLRSLEPSAVVARCGSRSSRTSR